MDYRIALDKIGGPPEVSNVERLKATLERAIIEANVCARAARKASPPAAA
ncbi:hypothetical protein [Caulobacter sp. CCUG 60055]|nr:hypothetical protein [Caulobacter sp. CCUG 60055]MBQ1541205.1 hypothetical protein [Caulobacteraceae bacterium]